MRRPGVAALAAAALAAACGGDGAAAAPEVDPQRVDPRVAPLLADCPRSDFYDRNVAEMIPILAEKLERGARDPLVRAKEELVRAGDEALPEVRRVLQRHFTERHGSPYLANALDVLKRSEAEGAHELLLQCLQHPADGVRMGAIQALQITHARPEDFDRLLAHLDLEVAEQRHQVAITLHAADAARAEGLYLDWIEGGVRPGLHRYVAPLIAASTEPETARRAGALYGEVGAELAAHLAAPAARAGDEDARAFLAAELARDTEPGDRQRRTVAVQAAIEAELAGLLRRVLAEDPDARLRALAAETLATAEPLSAATREALSLGLDDLGAEVRDACLGGLVEAGDAEAIDRALAMLDGTPASLQTAIGALRGRMRADPELARRVYERLAARDEKESFLPLADRTATLKSLGQVPLADAARLLRDRALERREETVERLRAHHWATIQAANAGEAGRAWLRAQLADEEDPLRRLDLLWAGTAARTDAVRAALVELVEGDALTPPELLFACDRMVRLGPAAEVAPRLKRLAPRVEDAEVRLALQCLLWTWY